MAGAPYYYSWLLTSPTRTTTPSTLPRQGGAPPGPSHERAARWNVVARDDVRGSRLGAAASPPWCDRGDAATAATPCAHGLSRLPPGSIHGHRPHHNSMMILLYSGMSTPRAVTENKKSQLADSLGTGHSHPKSQIVPFRNFRYPPLSAPTTAPKFDRKSEMVDFPHFPKLEDSGEISSVMSFWLAHDVPSGEYNVIPKCNYSITIPNYRI